MDTHREDILHELAEEIDARTSTMLIRGGPGTGKTHVTLKTLFYWFSRHALAYYVAPAKLLCMQFANDFAEMRLDARWKPAVYWEDDEAHASGSPGLHVMTYHRFATLECMDDREMLLVFDECHVLIDPFYFQQVARMVITHNFWVQPKILLTACDRRETVSKINSMFEPQFFRVMFTDVDMRTLHYLEHADWSRVVQREINRARNYSGRCCGLLVFLRRKVEVEEFYMALAGDARPTETYIQPPSIVLTGSKRETDRDAAYARMMNALRILVPQGIFYLHASAGREYTEYVFEELRRKTVNVLVATSVVAGGMNFPSIDDVYVRLSSEYGMHDTDELLHQMCGRAGRNGRHGMVYICRERQAERRKREIFAVRRQLGKTTLRSNSWSFDPGTSSFLANATRYENERQCMLRFAKFVTRPYAFPAVEQEGNVVTLAHPEILLCEEMEREQISEILAEIEKLELAHVFPIAQIFFTCIAVRHRFDALSYAETARDVDKRGIVGAYYVRIWSVLEESIHKLFTKTETVIISTCFMYALYEFVDHSTDTWKTFAKTICRMNDVMKAIAATRKYSLDRCMETLRVVDTMKDLQTLHEHANIVKMCATGWIDSSDEAEEHHQMTIY
jgi:superfamily II DNA or RNA helicase